MSGLTQQQVDKLLQPIKPRRVLKAQGQSHVAANDVIAHLTRIFGFGNWHTDIKELTLVHERIEQDDKGKVRAWVTYRCVLRLTIKDSEGSFVCHYEDVATGSAQNMPGVGDAHDFACKNAVSYAVKRCAKNLGDQYGLSLYSGGSLGPLVGITLVQPDAIAHVDVEDHAPEVTSLGNDERQVEVEGQLSIEVEPVESSPDLPCTPETWAQVAALKSLPPTTAADLKAWLKARGWTFTKAGLTESQALQVIEWAERRS